LKRDGEAKVTWPDGGRGDVLAELGVQRGESLVGIAVELGRHGVQHVPAPLGEVGDARCHALRVQGEPVGVRAHVLGGPLGQDPLARVGGDDLAVLVDDDRRVGHVRVEDVRERGKDRGDVGAVERRLRVGGCVAGRQEQLVALAERQAKRLGEPDDHLAARHRAAALDEAEVPLRRSGQQGQLKLAQPAGGAAFFQRSGEVHEFQL
jgi:hypothetical protein